MNNDLAQECMEEREKIREILENWEGKKDLIAILLSIQDHIGYLPEEGMLEVAIFLNISETTVYGVATFYNHFRFIPPGKRHIQVCMGTACHVKRGGTVLESWERRLQIKEGEVSEDREFSLERVNCVGCCVLAPVVVINDEVHGRMDSTKVDGFLLRYQLESEGKGNGSESDINEDEKGSGDGDND